MSPRPYSRQLALISGVLAGWLGGELIVRLGSLVWGEADMSEFEVWGYALVLLIFIVALIILWFATNHRD